jgi:hypothetical protein
MLRNKTKTPFDKEAAEIGVPVIPPLSPPHKFPNDPNPVMAICGKCGLHILRVMGYCCMSPNCPTGLGSGFTI